MIGRVFDNIKVRHIVIAAAVIYACALTKGLSLTGDDSGFILMSRNFLEKGFFHQIFFSNDLTQLYYIMLPAMLVPFSAIAPENYLLMKSLPFISAVLAVILFNEFLKGILSDRSRKITILLFALNPWTVRYSGMILTDTPYLFFSLACLVLFKKYWQGNKTVIFVMSVVFAGLSFYTRPFGIALCAALFVFLVIKKRWKECAGAIAIFAVMGMPLFAHFGGISSAYAKTFLKTHDYYAFKTKEVNVRQLAYRCAYNLLVYTGNYLPDIIAEPVVASIYPRLPDKKINPVFPIKFLLGTCLAAFIIIGYIATLREGLEPYHLYAVFHVAINAISNLYVARYLLSLLPFILLFLVAGVTAVSDKVRPFAHKAKLADMLYAGLVIISLTGAVQQIVNARTDYLPGNEKSFVECNDWIRAHLPKEAVILSRKPSYTKLSTGRETVGYILADDPDEQLSHIMKNGVEYAIIGYLGTYLNEGQYLINTVRKYPGSFKLLYTTYSEPKSYVYEVIRLKR